MSCIHLIPVQYIWSVSVYHSTECSPISPCRGHVSNIHSRISITCYPAPLLQGSSSKFTHYALLLFSHTTLPITHGVQALTGYNLNTQSIVIILFCTECDKCGPTGVQALTGVSGTMEDNEAPGPPTQVDISCRYRSII